MDLIIKNYKEIIDMIKENDNIIFEGIYSHFQIHLRVIIHLVIFNMKDLLM